MTACDDVLDQRLAPAMPRPSKQLQERLGPAEVVVEKLAAFGDAGVRQVLIWARRLPFAGRGG